MLKLKAAAVKAFKSPPTLKSPNLDMLKPDDRGISAIRMISEDLDFLTVHINKVFVEDNFDTSKASIQPGFKPSIQPRIRPGAGVKAVKEERVSPLKKRKLQQRGLSLGGKDNRVVSIERKAINRLGESKAVIKPIHIPSSPARLVIKRTKPVRSSSVYSRMPQIPQQPNVIGRSPRVTKFRKKNKSIESLYSHNDSAESLRHSSSFYYMQ
mmetsp:Transcript_28153/g.50371  ORF Transcript_28153/g.50371 Transcript_28153/m.50371 type:complete len:211 (-) Transcript_28153:11-643(-)